MANLHLQIKITLRTGSQGTLNTSVHSGGLSVKRTERTLGLPVVNMTATPVAIRGQIVPIRHEMPNKKIYKTDRVGTLIKSPTENRN